MKKLLPILIMVFLVTGCFKKDNLEGINIYTTVYPIEYITTKLYGEHSNIYSIYPDDVNIEEYELNDKQISDYSKGDMYIFNGLHEEKKYVTPMFKNNKSLMIIDATSTMEYNYYNEELWLDPSNFLMMALNIKNGLSEFIDNHYLKNEIEENYNALKIEISNLDAKLKILSENATHATIVVDKDSFKFLEKYGFTVISLEDNANLNEKTIADAETAIEEAGVNYLFTTNKDKLNETAKQFVEDNELEVLELKTITNLTEDERKNNDDYISLYLYNIEQLKNELY